MLNRFSAKMSPVLVGALSTWMLAACGSADVDQLQEAVVVTKAATLNQTDFNAFLAGIELSKCTFVIGGGNGTFTPSSKLSQVLYGDPNGAAHKATFPVPSISTPEATIDINSFEAEMATTGLTLSGANANVKVAFHGQLHIAATVPVVGKINADVQFKSSSLTLGIAYDTATERAKSNAVTTKFDIKVSKCGFLGWCNGAVEAFLKTSLPGLIEAPLKDAVTKGLDSASATDGLYELLGAAYNLKDAQPTPWTADAHSLSLAASQFSFTASRNSPLNFFSLQSSQSSP